MIWSFSTELLQGLVSTVDSLEVNQTLSLLSLNLLCQYNLTLYPPLTKDYMFCCHYPEAQTGVSIEKVESCYGLDICVLCWNPNPQGDGIRKWDLLSPLVVKLINRIRALIRKDRELPFSLSFSALWNTNYLHHSGQGRKYYQHLGCIPFMPKWSHNSSFGW